MGSEIVWLLKSQQKYAVGKRVKEKDQMIGRQENILGRQEEML